MSKNNKKYYVVWQGRKKGIFNTWKECEQQVINFSGARYKSYKTLLEAESAFNSQGNTTVKSLQNSRNLNKLSQEKLTSSSIIIDSICVDASCLGNPGIVEYRGVDTKTHEEIFHKSPMNNGTNNLGEFLAIVHGLAYLKKQNKNIPIYSDSRTAISWVKNKKIKTTLIRNSSNEEIFNLVDRALEWLLNNSYPNKILKWNSKEWGEIPADFGRK
ncbi:viroplasmin family protein [Cyanobacterium aponinum UTEX 3222]|uniref:ribonuclease H1 domain-containing protein n=1 Tax=Cyanobacterium aponinum TaxID=379064 RepID=UPI002B4BD240|nr:viroplasmin family protein [Cyanobacterium aponinum]WRL40017.1 viroplasmin family protein [Cyanobacterium aponinum UTEX 3221]WRL42907.1 viroplasmin family protein [Cyanobacterium aponinum UTEX 3222]